MSNWHHYVCPVPWGVFELFRRLTRHGLFGRLSVFSIPDILLFAEASTFVDLD